MPNIQVHILIQKHQARMEVCGREHVSYLSGGLRVSKVQHPTM